MNKQERFNMYINMLNQKGLLNENTPKISAIQLVGDRSSPSISMKEYAFTIPANPMSDRGQMILIIEDDDNG